LEKYDVIEKGKINRNIPERDGIYFLYDINDALLYLSGSANIRNRVKYHINKNKHKAFVKIPPSEITKVAFVTISKSQIRDIAESLYLLHYKPKYNVTHFSATKLVILS
jgi:excinuclease UvrABC nuclease subunit